VPGKTYRVRIFPVSSDVSSQDILRFLESKQAILTGAHGLLLLHEKMPKIFPRKSTLVSFDYKEALYTLSCGFRMVSETDQCCGVRVFNFGNFMIDWEAGHRLVCFSEVN
jgi:hypothetical protein